MSEQEWGSLIAVGGFVAIVLMGLITGHATVLALTPIRQKRFNITIVGAICALAAIFVVSQLSRRPFELYDPMHVPLYSGLAIGLVAAFVLGGLVRARSDG